MYSSRVKVQFVVKGTEPAEAQAPAQDPQKKEPKKPREDGPKPKAPRKPRRDEPIYVVKGDPNAKSEEQPHEEEKVPRTKKERTFTDKRGQKHEIFIPEKHFKKDSKAFKTKILAYHNNIARLKQIQRIWAVLTRRSASNDVAYHHIVEIYEGDVHSTAVLIQFFYDNDFAQYACDLYQISSKSIEKDEEGRANYADPLRKIFADLIGAEVTEDSPQKELVPAEGKQSLLERVPKAADKFEGAAGTLSLRTMNITEKDVILIDGSSREAFDEAIDTLSKSDIVALDIKLTHYSVNSKKVKPCILQMGTRKKVYLFDLKSLRKIPEETVPFGDRVSKILNDKNILKITFDFQEDYNYLVSDQFGEMYFAEFRQSYDLHHEREVPKHDGLKDLLEKQLKISIDKSELISNWEKRPLRRAQLHYAAVEILALTMLYDAIYQSTFQLVKQQRP